MPDDSIPAEDTKPQLQNVQNISDVPDWFLEFLVRMTNDKVGIGISLHVDGFIVSGIMISGDEYFELFAESFACGLSDPEDAQATKKALASNGDVYKRVRHPDTPPPEGYLSFVHLKNVKFYGSPAPFPGDGALWRGRLSKVSGFFLGTIG